MIRRPSPTRPSPTRRRPRSAATGVVAAAVGLALALAGCAGSGTSGSGPELKVSGAYIPQPIDDSMAAGYLIVTNDGSGADQLTGITSSLADTSDITIHKTENQRMTKVSSFDIPAHGQLDLERGGNHIMFMNLKKKPLRGEKVSLELHFAKAEPITIEVPVRETTYNPKHS